VQVLEPNCHEADDLIAIHVESNKLAGLNVARNYNLSKSLISFPHKIDGAVPNFKMG
jgi:hypothetical protein